MHKQLAFAMTSTTALLYRAFGRSLYRSSRLKCYNLCPIRHSSSVSNLTSALHPSRTSEHLSIAGSRLSLSNFLQLTRTSAFQATNTSDQLPTRLPLFSILQFARTSFRNATHRDLRGSGSSYGRGGRPPPRKPLFAWIESIPDSVIFYGIIGLNLCVFLTWQAGVATWQQARDTALLKFLMENFVISAHNIKSGRVWTLVTSCFSHREMTHILFNGLTFYFMAPAVMQILGKTRFLGLYFIGGILSGLTSIIWNDFVKYRPINAQGASGAIYAIAAYFACALPRTTFLIFFVIPCPAWVFLPGVLAYDTYRTITNSSTTTDTAGHVGGLLAGIAYFVARRFGILL